MPRETHEQEAQLAWTAWNALEDLARLLWERYETSFVDYCCSEAEMEAFKPPEQLDLFYSEEDDIPF